MSIPVEIVNQGIDWPAWVQAFGSVIAIAAGFGYIAVQQRLAAGEVKRRQSDMRAHSRELARSILEFQVTTIGLFEDALSPDVAVCNFFSSEVGKVFGQELVSVPAVDVGTSNFALLARKIGLHHLAFIDVADACVGRQPTADEMARLRQFKVIIEKAAAAMATFD